MLLGAAVGVAVMILAATPASAAGEKRENCTTWQQVTEMQNSTEWVRVSERACIVWINYGNKVRAVAQLRLDWPSQCTLGDCGFKALKAAKMSFDQIWIGAGWNFNGAQNTTGCPYERGPYRWNLREIVLECGSGWLPHPVGTYSVKAAMVVDLDNDGAGATVFEPTTVLSLTFG